MKNEPAKIYTLDEMVDKHIGKRGTQKRDRFEYDLKMDLIGDAIREARKKRKYKLFKACFATFAAK